MKVGRQQFVGGVLRRDGAPEWGGRDVSLGWGLEQSQGRTPVSALE